ncbi:MAG TPA: serine/threonine-protein kinase [Kofleriaceae bacterium]|nr:serine/threonine-protein kinase [Kofleriaceae bacterium]
MSRRQELLGRIGATVTETGRAGASATVTDDGGMAATSPGLETTTPGAPPPPASAGSGELPDELDVSAGFDRKRAVERAEDERTILRTRGILRLAIMMIPVYVGMDWAILGFIEPGRFWMPMVVRFPALVSMAAVLVWLNRAPPFPSGRRVLEVERISTLTISLSCSLCCVVAGGIGSLEAVTVTLVLVGRSVMRSDRWQDGLLSIAVIWLAHPIVLLVAALFMPRLAAQLHDPAQVARLVLFVIVNGVVAGFILAGGDATWRLRRQLTHDNIVGRYKLRRLLGAGGMGEVWSAYFPPLRREVALKILRADERPRPVAVARFEREARATAELTHPNTVRVLDFGVTEDGLWFYAMELLEGETLDQLVRREGPLPAARAAHLVLQAARALTEAHQRGIVHRDIKPQNLFVTTMGGERDFIKLLDFGIARVLRPDSGELLTRTGALAGTPAYFSPELAGGQHADERSDIYGLGAVLYQALTGVPPFQGSELTGLLAAILFDPVRPMAEVRGDAVPAELDAIVMRCLAREPTERFATSHELVAALDGWAREHRWLPPPAGA